MIKRTIKKICLTLKKKNLSLNYFFKTDAFEVNKIYNIIIKNKKIILYGNPIQNIKCAYIECACRINPMIWVSEQYKTIYFEIPKSASSSIKKEFAITAPSLLQVFGYLILKSKSNLTIKINTKESSFSNNYIKKTFREAVQIHKKTKFNSPRTLSDAFFVQFPNESFVPYYGSANDAIQDFPNYFSFSFIRNPYDRLVSNWSMFTQVKYRQIVFEEIFNKKANLVTFNEFISNIENIYNHHWSSQTILLPKKEDTSININFLGKLENFDSDWKKVCTILKVSVKNIANENKTEHKSYLNYYTTKQFEKISLVYKEDLIFYH